MKVGQVLRLLRREGWYRVPGRGDQRQFKHPRRPGRITVSGKGNSDLVPRTLRGILAQAGLEEAPMTIRFAIVVEKAASNYAAYVPDLPGCVATGATVAEAEQRLRAAIAEHVRGLRADGMPAPVPTSVVDYVEVVFG